MCGIMFRLFVAAILCCLGSQENARSVRNCCNGNDLNDLDPGIGLLAENQVVVTLRKASLSLDCLVVSEPQFGNLTFTWKKSGQKIRTRSGGRRGRRRRRHVFPNGTLHFRKIVRHMKEEGDSTTLNSDEGLYECYVTNSIGTVLAQRVKVLVATLGKSFTREPDDREVRVGESVFLPCQIEVIPADHLVVWQKDTAVIKIPDNSRYTQIKGGLLIVDAQEEDSGEYQCQVTNQNFFNFIDDNSFSPLQWRNSHKALITVTADAEPQDVGLILTPDKETEVVIGGAVDLPCVPSDIHPSPVTWMYAVSADSDGVPVETSHNMTVLPSGILRIERAYRDLGGMYTCSHRGVDTSVTTLLHVMEEPVIQESSMSRVYPLASTVSLECLVTGYPPPTITWLKDGQLVTTIRYRVEMLKYDLRIYQGKIQDSGYYQCLAQNSVGWALSLSRISVIVHPEAPQPPYNVSGKALSSSRVQVRWEMDSSMGRVLSYTIHRRLAHEEGGEVVEIMAKVQQREAVLHGLTPDTYYAITIRAYGKKGASPVSQPIFIRTDLTGYPTFTVSRVDNSSMHLNWSDFFARHRLKHDIASYRIFYGQSNGKDVDSVEVDSSHSSYKLTDLQEDQEYRVRMMAVFKDNNTNFYVDDWPWTYLRTGPLTVPGASPNLGAPYNIQAFVLEPNAVSLSWLYPEVKAKDNLPVTHYSVRCQTLEYLALGSRCQETAAQSVVIKTSHSNQVTLDNLKAFTLYNISVAAHSDDHQGQYSRPILIQTKEGVPSQPMDLKAEVVSKNQVRLQWQPPTWPNGLISGHYIEYVNQQQSSDKEIQVISNSNGHSNGHTWIQVYQRGNTTWAIVSNLTNHLYLFQVMACTSAGKGAPSSHVFVHMEAVRPSPGGLSDQHLGILGGSVIGLSSILITVIVILCKQRQLQRQLENEMDKKDTKQPLSRPHDLQSPVSLISQLSPSPAQSEELEKLLDSRLPPAAVIEFSSTPNPLAPPTDTSHAPLAMPNDTGHAILAIHEEAGQADRDSTDSGCSFGQGEGLDPQGAELDPLEAELIAFTRSPTERAENEAVIDVPNLNDSAALTSELRETTC